MGANGSHNGPDWHVTHRNGSLRCALFPVHNIPPATIQPDLSRPTQPVGPLDIR